MRSDKGCFFSGHPESSHARAQDPMFSVTFYKARGLNFDFQKDQCFLSLFLVSKGASYLCFWVRYHLEWLDNHVMSWSYQWIFILYRCYSPNISLSLVPRIGVSKKASGIQPFSAIRNEPTGKFLDRFLRMSPKPSKSIIICGWVKSLTSMHRKEPIKVESETVQETKLERLVGGRKTLSGTKLSWNFWGWKAESWWV